MPTSSDVFFNKEEKKNSGMVQVYVQIGRVGREPWVPHHVYSASVWLVQEWVTQAWLTVVFVVHHSSLAVKAYKNCADHGSATKQNTFFVSVSVWRNAAPYHTGRKEFGYPKRGPSVKA